MLTARNVTLSYPDGEGRLVVLNQVLLDAKIGVTALVGPSGSGKSSLLRVLSGLQAADAGTVRIGEESFDCRDAGEGHPRAIYIPQDFQLVPFLTAEENIRLAAEIRRQPVPDVGELLALVGLAGLAGRRPGQLSGGQQQRLALARALSVSASVLMPDEPTGSLDAATSAEIAHVLHEVAWAGQRAIVVATHDEAVVQQADAVVEVHSGTVCRVR